MKDFLSYAKTLVTESHGSGWFTTESHTSRLYTFLTTLGNQTPPIKELGQLTESQRLELYMHIINKREFNGTGAPELFKKLANRMIGGPTVIQALTARVKNSSVVSRKNVLRVDDEASNAATLSYIDYFQKIMQSQVEKITDEVNATTLTLTQSEIANQIEIKFNAYLAERSAMLCRIAQELVELSACVNEDRINNDIKNVILSTIWEQITQLPVDQVDPVLKSFTVNLTKEIQPLHDVVIDIEKVKKVLTDYIGIVIRLNGINDLRQKNIDAVEKEISTAKLKENYEEVAKLEQKKEELPKLLTISKAIKILSNNIKHPTATLEMLNFLEEQNLLTDTNLATILRCPHDILLVNFYKNLYQYLPNTQVIFDVLVEYQSDNSNLEHLDFVILILAAIVKPTSDINSESLRNILSLAGKNLAINKVIAALMKLKEAQEADLAIENRQAEDANSTDKSKKIPRVSIGELIDYIVAYPDTAQRMAEAFAMYKMNTKGSTLGIPKIVYGKIIENIDHGVTIIELVNKINELDRWNPEGLFDKIFCLDNDNFLKVLGIDSKCYPQILKNSPLLQTNAILDQDVISFLQPYEEQTEPVQKINEVITNILPMLKWIANKQIALSDMEDIKKQCYNFTSSSLMVADYLETVSSSNNNVITKDKIISCFKDEKLLDFVKLLRNQKLLTSSSVHSIDKSPNCNVLFETYTKLQDETDRVVFFTFYKQLLTHQDNPRINELFGDSAKLTSTFQDYKKLDDCNRKGFWEELSQAHGEATSTVTAASEVPPASAATPTSPVATASPTSVVPNSLFTGGSDSGDGKKQTEQFSVSV